MISQKEISNKEIVQEVYKLIDENIHLNAFVTLNEDNSLKKAEGLDNNPSDSPLAGIPIAQKDLFCTKGLRTSCGSKILDNFIPPYSATVIENLENAGCISVSKTNMDEFAMGSSNETSYFGNVHNPWGDKLVPGGKDAGKTAKLRGQLAKLGAENALIIGGAELDEALVKAARNIPLVDILPQQGINVYDILRRDVLVLSKDAAAHLEERLK